MIIKLEMTKDTPIYEQLKQQIVEGIALGRLQTGEELPSVRQLAADLSVNMHTVAKAYNQLKDDGFLTVHRNKGVVVNPPHMYAADAQYRTYLDEVLRTNAVMARCRGIGKEEWVKLCSAAYDDGAIK